MKKLRTVLAALLLVAPVVTATDAHAGTYTGGGRCTNAKAIVYSGPNRTGSSSTYSTVSVYFVPTISVRSASVSGSGCSARLSGVNPTTGATVAMTVFTGTTVNVSFTVKYVYLSCTQCTF